jgi:hypothetical protein
VLGIPGRSELDLQQPFRLRGIVRDGHPGRWPGLLCGSPSGCIFAPIHETEPARSGVGSKGILPLFAHFTPKPHCQPFRLHSRTRTRARARIPTHPPYSLQSASSSPG